MNEQLENQLFFEEEEAFSSGLFPPKGFFQSSPKGQIRVCQNRVKLY